MTMSAGSAARTAGRWTDPCRHDGPIAISCWVGFATVASLILFATKSVTVKLLPFDNKSEFQIVVDLPRGSSLELTDRVLHGITHRLVGLNELASVQAYAGTAHRLISMGWFDITIFATNRTKVICRSICSKIMRKRSSHEIALDARNRLKDMVLPEGASLKWSRFRLGHQSFRPCSLRSMDLILRRGVHCT